MPSYLRLLTEKPSNITTPPLGHTALFASSGTTPATNQYDLYIMNPDGFISQVGGFQSGGTFSGNIQANSGITVYSGGYTSSGSPTTAIVIDGILSGLSDNTVYVSPGLNVSGQTSGTTNLIYGTANTMTGVFSQAFGTANTVSQTASTAFGSGNTVSASVAFGLGGNNIVEGEYSLVAGSANTAATLGSVVFGGGNSSSAEFGVALGGRVNTLASTATYGVVGGTNNTVNGRLGFSFGTGNTVGASSSAVTVFGTANTANANSSFVVGGNNTSTGEISFVAGSGNTASGTSQIVLGKRNVYSGIFSVGDGGDMRASNRITAQSTGVTIGMSGAGKPDVFVFQDTASNAATSLLVLSGAGDHPLGFKLPLVQHLYNHKSGAASNIAAWPALSANTRIDNSGMMVWDGNNIRVWTGGTLWAKLGLVDDANPMSGI